MKKIGIFSPSNNVLGFFPQRTKQGLKNLKELDLIPVLSKNYQEPNNYREDNVKKRVKELNELLDSNVDIIISSIGGYLSNQILPYINYNKIKEKKIIFCGSSDITAILLAIYIKTGLKVIYGPTYTVDLCNYEGIDSYTKEYFLKCINHENYNLVPSSFYVSEYIDWNELETKPKAKQTTAKDPDWHIIKKGQSNGVLLGGNLSTILLILGTEYLPIEAFNNTVLFLEDCETNINEFASYMQTLKLHGILDNIRGLMIGKFDTEEMNKDIDEFINDFMKNYNIPIITNMDFGHISPMLSLMIGSTIKIDTNKKIDIEINN